MKTNNASGRLKHIAMWSGPRNLSTAMMRAWENRPDTYVHDEPFYGYFLLHSGRDDPNAKEVLAHSETSWSNILKDLTGSVPADKTIYFQKHMGHHLLDKIDDLTWLPDWTHFFLIREPREMLTSLIRLVPHPTLKDTGLPQQKRLFDHIYELTDTPPPLIDARDLQDQPRQTLTLLCEAIGVEFTEAMLSWPAGRRETDNIQAKYWYVSVEKSTGFRPYKPKEEAVPGHLLEMFEECNEIYRQLHKHRLMGQGSTSHRLRSDTLGIDSAKGPGA